MKVAGVVILDAVRELVLGMRDVVEHVAVILVEVIVLLVLVVGVVVRLDVRHFHFELRPLHRPVEVHVRAGY